MSALVLAIATAANAQEVGADPRPIWDQAVGEAVLLSTDEARIEHLFTASCENGRAANLELQRATPKLFDTIGKAIALVANAEPSEKLAKMAGEMIGGNAANITNISVTVGFWAGLCADYSRQLRAFDPDTSKEK